LQDAHYSKLPNKRIKIFPNFLILLSQPEPTM